MNTTHIRRTASVPLMIGMLLLLGATVPVAKAQEPPAKLAVPAAPAQAETPPQAPSVQEAAQFEDGLETEPLQIGDATQGLLAWQRSGELASATPRPIAGSVANRSYERYLKSFEFPIPERLISTVKTGSATGSK